MGLIEERTLILESWITNPDITEKQVTSSVEIPDTAVLTHEFMDHGDTIWDNCDNVSQSFTSSVTYQFNNFPIQFVTRLRKQGEADGFEFRVTFNDMKAIYKFHNDYSSTKNTIELLPDYTLNGVIHQELFKITFYQASLPTEIKTLYFIKQEGVIFIELNNGMTINLN